MLAFRKFIFISLLGLLFVPLIQSNLHIVALNRLSGAYTLSDDTTFTFPGWFSGKYQARKELFLRDTFGLRNLLIRTHNQIDFSFFRKPNAADVAIGKNDNFYNYNYLEAYNGSDFLGSRSINDIMAKLKKIQDTLEQKHKTFLIVFAPGKGFYDPEFVPDGYVKNDSNNYNVSVKLAKGYKLNYIDFNKYFRDIRQQSPYPLYSKYSSHWSPYAACIAGDSIVTMLEKLRNIKMPHTVWKNNIIAEEANGDELELEYELNLLFPLKHPIMGHPQIKNDIDTSKKKPSVLIIGDSYIWGLMAHYNFNACFSSSVFCYYYQTIYTAGSSKTIDRSNFNLKDALNKNDIIIVGATTPGLRTFTWGFADDAGKILYQGYSNEAVSSFRNEMKLKPDLMKEITLKAKKYNLSVDSMLTLDAIWMVQHQN